LLSVLPLTQPTLVPDPFTKDPDTLTVTLNEYHTEHIRKIHQRHDHPQLATHTTTRSQSTHEYIHNPHTQIEILSEILLKDSVASKVDLVLSSKQQYRTVHASSARQDCDRDALQAMRFSKPNFNHLRSGSQTSALKD